MKVLSLFDGISGCRQALKELNIDCEYYASEIDKYAIQVAKANHSDIVHIGDVKNLFKYHHFNDGRYNQFYNIGRGNFDLLIGGSPCQDLSIAKKDRKGLEGDRSSLFYEYVRILNEVKPKYFILENVASMSKESKNIITKELFDIEPIMINSALLTAQNRKRLYWVGKLIDGEYKQVKIEQPKDQEIYLKDIIEDGIVDRDKSYCVDKVKYETIKKSYQKRVNKISSEFNQYLKESRGGLTYKEIAINLNLPLTQVEHYFRTDKSRAIPNIENYKKLKEILSLNNNWDKLVMEFETKQSTYEQNLRLYNINGKSPTLTLNCNIPIRVGHFNTGGQGDRVYSINGKSVCLSANGGGRGAKTGLYAIAQRGRNIVNGKRRDIKGAKTEQRFETIYSEKSNTLTTVQKDSMLLDGCEIRKLTVNECCRLQGFPDGYCDSVSKTQSYKGLGNSFTVPVIKHLIQSI